MNDFLEWLAMRPVNGINVLILLVLLWVLYRVIQDEGNIILWSDYISTRGADGKQHGDPNKLLQMMGGVVACVSVLMYADNEKVDAVGLAAVLGVVLGFCAGPVMWAASLRSKQGSITTVTEPAPDSSASKVTTVQMLPAAKPTIYAEGK